MGREVTIKITAQDSFSSVMNKYQREMGEAERVTKQAGESAKDSKSGFDQLGTAMGGMIAAIGIQQVISFAEGFNQLGTEVHANRVLFDTLTESIGGNAAVLESLRAATGNVVSDLDLMSGASQLLRLNIVDNNDDLAMLTGQIQKLKQPTESTTDAIQNFALMLSNESLLRLDSFGISSANVKRRMDELGMSFREATMAEMATAVERLGDAGTVAETGLARLQTKLENFWNQGAENFAIGFNAAIEGGEAFLQYINGTLPSQLAESEAGAAFVSAGTRAAEEFFQGFAGGVDPDMERRMTEFAERYASILQATDGAPLANRTQQLLDLATQTLELPLTADNDLFRQMEFLATMVEGHQRLLEYQELETAQWARGAEEASRLNILLSDQFEMARQAAAEQERAMALDPAAEAMQRLYALQNSGGRGHLGNQMLFTPAEAAEATQLLNQFNNFLDLAKDSDIITDEQLQMLKDGASEVKDMATNIQKGADAFLSMNLSEMLGTGNGGALGELTDRLAAAMEEMGQSEEAIAAFQAAANLRSGRDTDLSQGIDAFLQSQLADAGIDAQLQALTNLANTMAMGRQQNVQMTPEDFNRMAGLFANGNINPNFDPQFALDAMEALQRGRENGFGADGANDDLATFAANAEEASTSLGVMKIAGDDFLRTIEGASTALDAIGAKRYPLRFNVEGIPDWLNGLLNGGGAGVSNFFDALENTVGNQGGSTPGESHTNRGERVVKNTKNGK